MNPFPITAPAPAARHRDDAEPGADVCLDCGTNLRRVPQADPFRWNYKPHRCPPTIRRRRLLALIGASS